MNYWIHSQARPAAPSWLAHIDILMVNDSEARELVGRDWNIYRAAR